MTTRYEEGGSWAVPWIHQSDWEEMLQLTRNNCEGLGASRAEVMRYIDAIVTLYEEIETPLSSLCGATCQICKEACCTKATVWYDQRDITIYHLAIGFFPEKQVSRSVTGACCHLGEDGCRLPRLERPFICTWYICGAQTTILRREVGNPAIGVLGQIHRIKEIRKRIGALCLQV
ncbi:MAG: hypothetical protein ACI8ZB_003033 [Desulforhopalus sp.]|jgi:hypothetical protein